MAYLGATNQLQSKVEIYGGAAVGSIAEFIQGKLDPTYLECTGLKYDPAIYKQLFDYLGTDDLPLITHDVPVGGVQWFPNRTSMHQDFVPADGDKISALTAPQLAERLTNNELAVIDDAAWLADALKRAAWTVNGDIIRTPDLNGKQEGSVGALFLRGDGKNAAQAGEIQGDCIRNITGRVVPKNTSGQWTAVGDPKEAFDVLNNNISILNPSGSSVSYSGGISFDASRVVPTGPENRPVAATGCYGVRIKTSTVFGIKAFGAVVNEGLVDVAAIAAKNMQLQSDLSKAQSEIAKMKADDAWHTNESPVFQKYFRFGPGWSANPKEVMIKKTDTELLVRGIFRRTTGAFPTNPVIVMQINNPERATYSWSYMPFLTTAGTLGSGNVPTGYASLYCDNNGGTSSAVVDVASAMLNRDSFPGLVSWIMVDLTFMIRN